MGFVIDRVSVISSFVRELARSGLPEASGPLDGEVAFMLDGVGGFQFVPVLARKALREEGSAMGTIWFRWQFPIPGQMLVDLVWLKRNRVMSVQFARELLAFHRAHPRATLHLIAFSGGTAIAVFALEALRGRVPIETLLLACPAICPDYNLGPALRAVRRCYALVSNRDRWLLGIGTGIFGTMDRVRCSSAGRVGFRRPQGLSAEDAAAYDRLRELHWTPELRREGHCGGHTAWANVRFLRRHLLPILCGRPLLRTREVTEGGG